MVLHTGAVLLAAASLVEPWAMVVLPWQLPWLSLGDAKISLRLDHEVEVELPAGTTWIYGKLCYGRANATLPEARKFCQEFHGVRVAATLALYAACPALALSALAWLLNVGCNRGSCPGAASMSCGVVSATLSVGAVALAAVMASQRDVFKELVHVAQGPLLLSGSAFAALAAVTSSAKGMRVARQASRVAAARQVGVPDWAAGSGGWAAAANGGQRLFHD